MGQHAGVPESLVVPLGESLRLQSRDTGDGLAHLTLGAAYLHAHVERDCQQRGQRDRASQRKGACLSSTLRFIR